MAKITATNCPQYRADLIDSCTLNPERLEKCALCFPAVSREVYANCIRYNLGRAVALNLPEVTPCCDQHPHETAGGTADMSEGVTP